MRCAGPHQACERRHVETQRQVGSQGGVTGMPRPASQPVAHDVPVVPAAGRPQEPHGAVFCWHVQGQAFGGLDPEIAKHLDGLAQGNKPGADCPRRLKPGTVLLREYQDYFSQVSSAKLERYVERCLESPFPKGGMVLQDERARAAARLQGDKRTLPRGLERHWVRRHLAVTGRAFQWSRSGSGEAFRFGLTMD
jgi:hypothetical protein